MSEAYWFGGLRFEHFIPPDVDAEHILFARRQLLKALAKEYNLQPARLERVDWFSKRMEGLYSREALPAGNGNSPLTFLWPALPLVSHVILENTCAALTQEAAVMTALVEEGKTHSEAALLGSPTAVGKFNLTPHARLRAHTSAAWISQPFPDCYIHLAAFLDRLEIDPKTIAALAIGSPVLQEELQRPDLWKDVPVFSNPSENGILPALNWLAGTLRDGGGNGLLASFTKDRRAMFTLVEKV